LAGAARHCWGSVGLYALGMVVGCGVGAARWNRGSLEAIDGVSGEPATTDPAVDPDGGCDGEVEQTALEPPAAEPKPVPECVALGEPTELVHAMFFELLNRYRRENGLAALEYSLTLQQAADAHAEHMFRERFFNHIWPDGTTPADRALDAGFCHDLVGENIAYGLNSRETATEVMAQLSNSPIHDDNMLFEHYRYVGVGAFHHVGDRGDEYWWVQLFALE